MTENNAEPTIASFLNFVETNFPDIELSDFQIELATSLIEYRRKHHSGGCRSGRTFTVLLVQQYLDKKFSHVRHAGKEI